MGNINNPLLSPTLHETGQSKTLWWEVFSTPGLEGPPWPGNDPGSPTKAEDGWQTGRRKRAVGGLMCLNGWP